MNSEEFTLTTYSYTFFDGSNHTTINNSIYHHTISIPLFSPEFYFLEFQTFSTYFILQDVAHQFKTSNRPPQLHRRHPNLKEAALNQSRLILADQPLLKTQEHNPIDHHRIDNFPQRSKLRLQPQIDHFSSYRQNKRRIRHHNG